MKAHIVGGGFGGLAAAGCLIRNAGLAGRDIIIYEADEQLGGGFFLGGNAATGFNPPGSVFDAEFRCTFDLLQTVPSATDPSVSVTDAFFSFNLRNPLHDRAHIIDRNDQKVQSAHYGLSLGDAFSFVRLVPTLEATMDGRRIEEFFSPRFFLD
jgi:oleate hydratase